MTAFRPQGVIVLLGEVDPPSRRRVVAMQVPRRGVLTSAAPTGSYGGLPAVPRPGDRWCGAVDGREISHAR
jgi:hypothetical protein